MTRSVGPGLVWAIEHPLGAGPGSEVCWHAGASTYATGARDQAILADLLPFGALTVGQITRRQFGAKITAYKHLERLAEAGYVELARWWRLGPGVYRPTRAGARASLGLEPERLRIGALPHDLAVAELVRDSGQLRGGVLRRDNRRRAPATGPVLLHQCGPGRLTAE